MSDDLTPMAREATMMHELFTAYTAAGFTERQALQLLALLATQQPEKGQQQ